MRPESLAFGLVDEQIDSIDDEVLPEEKEDEKIAPNARRSIYVVEFEENLRTVMKEESNLFYKSQLEIFKKYEGLSEKGRYLFVRLSGRKDGWHRVSSLKYVAELGDVGAAMDELCGRKPNTTQSPGVHSSSVAGPSSRPEVIDLTLDSEDEDEEEERPRRFQFGRDEGDMCLQELLECANVDELKQLAKTYKLNLKQPRRDAIIDGLLALATTQTAFSFTPVEGFAGFSKPKTKTGASTSAYVEAMRKRVCKILGKCIRLTDGVIGLMQRLDVVCYRSTQWESRIMLASMLARFQKRNPVPRIINRSKDIWTRPEDLDEYMTALKLASAMDTLLDGDGSISQSLLDDDIIPRLETPVRKRSIPVMDKIYTPGPSNVRTPTPGRRTSMSQTPKSQGKGKRKQDDDDEVVVKPDTDRMKRAREAKTLFEEKIYGKWKELLEADEDAVKVEEEELKTEEGEFKVEDDDVKAEGEAVKLEDVKFELDEEHGLRAMKTDATTRRKALQRFHPLHIYTRLVEKGSAALGLLHEYDREFDILNELIAQPKWRQARRGKWYERRALVAMSHLRKDKAAHTRTLKGVIQALKDPNTHLIYLPKLGVRLAKLEKTLKIPEEDRHVQETAFRERKEITIKGIRVIRPPTSGVVLDPVGRVVRGPLDAMFRPPPEKSSWKGKSKWKGRKGDEITVEALAIEHYEESGYTGLHSEGSIVRMLFGLLMFDIIYARCPGAFETQFQVAPMDLGLDTFYYAREDLISERLAALEAGQGREILERVDDECRESKVYCVGVHWDAFTKEQLVEIVECIGGKGLAAICELLCRDYRARGGGVPDLFIWEYGSRLCKFVEVKGPGDTLAEHQKLWIDVLDRANIPVEVCHVMERWGDKPTPTTNTTKDKPGKGKGRVTKPKEKKVAAEEDGGEPELRGLDSDIEEVLPVLGEPSQPKLKKQRA